MRTSVLVHVDEALVLRSQAGDAEAMGELAGQVRPLVQRYASRFFPDPSRAEDLAQTALMKAFSRVGDVRSPEAFAAWLLRITRNECLNELARQRHAQVPLSALDDRGTGIEVPPGGADDPEEELVRTHLRRLVRRVAATLPPHYRKTLTMRALEDRSYEEISAALDVPVTVARLWYCRARKRFRTAFLEAMVTRRDVTDACHDIGLSIAEMIEGSLPRAQRDRIQGHLAGCAVCRQTEEELRNTAYRAPTRALVLGLGAARLSRSWGRALRGTAGHAQVIAARTAVAGIGSVSMATAGSLVGLTTAPPAGVPAAARATVVAGAVAQPPPAAGSSGALSDSASGSDTQSGSATVAAAPDLMDTVLGGAVTSVSVPVDLQLAAQRLLGRSLPSLSTGGVLATATGCLRAARATTSSAGAAGTATTRLTAAAPTAPSL